MYASSASDPTVQPYNTAYLRDDRSHLYEEFDVDPAVDDGIVRPNGERSVPPDFSERRAAILSFYGNRCGRCLAEITTVSAGTETDLGYCYSVAGATGATDRWALEHLVAVCEPCYELLTIEDPDRLDAFGSAYRDAPLFPQWLGDPRVAVERIPLTGRELWLRERVADPTGDRTERIGDGARERSVTTETSAAPINEPAATRACLARSTPATVAVALGEQLRTAAQRPVPTEQLLGGRWEALSEESRSAFEARADHWRALVEGSFVPALC